jgi:hypothetical protein
MLEQICDVIDIIDFTDLWQNDDDVILIDLLGGCMTNLGKQDPEKWKTTMLIVSNFIKESSHLIHHAI